MNDHLPIYRLKPEDTSAERLIDVSQRVFGIRDDFRFSTCNGVTTLESGPQVVELAPASGAVWAANTAQLWKPTVRAEIPKVEEAMASADRHLQANKLLPSLAPPFRFGSPTVGGTHYALRRKGQREHRQLDVHVSYPIFAGEIPLVGGGSDVSLTLGHRGSVIAFSGGWRTPVGSFEAKVIARAQADEQFRTITQGLKLESFDASLGYYCAPGFRAQEFLYPVYVYRAKARFGKQVVPLRQILLPATDFGPALQFGELQPLRKRRERPPVALSEAVKAAGRRRFAVRNLVNPFEAGTSWIGQSGGLAGSQANAQGFIDEWSADGWRINFNWGDANAWESDWRRNDDTWVDAADFVFYTGHANMNGWTLANPDDGSLDFSEVGAAPASPGDLWGQNDLEWAVIAACGPLQDQILSPGGGDVLARWDGAFDGMHILMGYGAVTFDNTDEGRKLAQYAKGGATLIDAWFRAAREIQPATNGFEAPDGPTIWVGAMWVGRDGIDPVHDHAWGHGSVSPDPTNPTWLACMWTTC